MSDKKTTGSAISDTTYDKLKRTVQLVLPGLATLYFAIAQIWGLAYGEQVVGTITALTTFLGIVLTVTSRSYNASEAKYDGALVVDTSDPDKDIYSLEVSTPLHEVNSLDQIILKIDNAQKLKSQ